MLQRVLSGLSAAVGRLLDRLMPARAARRQGLDRAYVRRSWRYTSLQFSRSDAQSRMLRKRPDALLVDYTRTMMAVLLFQPAPRLLGMVGLGGGSQAKFCHRHLPHTRVEAVEINPQVIALRDAFRIPADDDRLGIYLGEGQAFLRERPGRYDALLVDGYDTSGIPASLSSQDFYHVCRRALSADGVLSVNLYGVDVEQHIARIRRAFGPDAVLVVKEPKMSNRVVFAWAGKAASKLRYERGLARPPPLDAEARAQLQPVFDRVGVALQRQRRS